MLSEELDCGARAKQKDDAEYDNFESFAAWVCVQYPASPSFK